MDAYQVTRIVYARIQSLEPEDVSKIMSYLLLQGNGDQEMLHLAFGSDASLQAMILKSKKELGLPLSGSLHASVQLSSPHLSNHAQLSQPSLRSPPPAIDFLDSMHLGIHGQHDRAVFPQEQLPASAAQTLKDLAYLNFNRPAVHDQLSPHEIFSPRFEKIRLYSEQGLPNEYQPRDQFGFLNNSPEEKSCLNVFPNDNPYPDMYAILNGGKLNADPFDTRSNGRSICEVSLSPESTSASAWKPCVYYACGYCKHGSNCRFLHSHLRPDTLSPLALNNSQRDTRSDGDGSLSPGTLERLELELQDLLRGRRAPVSIASLPQLYYERYGKTLQAEGYLTESQRHGKAGYSLTKLLARLKNTVTVIDRPHGQHAVVLAEEAHKFLAYREGRDDLSGVNPGSRQIYLTFPAESTFTEDDVSAHFRAYGPVQDVRIPYQQKRMFGFVTFVYSETVKIILAKGHPHYICGARVLVKPYKEKGKHSERKISDRGEYSRCMPSHGLDGREFDFPPGSRFFNDHELTMQRQPEHQDQMLELEMQRLADMQLADMKREFANIELSGLQAAQAQSIHGLSGLGQLDETARTQDMHQLQASSTYGYLFDVLDSDQGAELKTQGKEDCALQSGHNLPDSPFTSPHAQSESKAFFLTEKIKKLSLDRQDAGPFVSVPAISEGNTECKCRICMGYSIDPIQLDCNHMFCVQCILKVIRVSKDECPICRQHIGSQIVKLLESRGLQVIDLPLTRRGGAQTMW